MANQKRHPERCCFFLRRHESYIVLPLDIVFHLAESFLIEGTHMPVDKYIPPSQNPNTKWEGTMLEMLEVAEHSIADQLKKDQSPSALARAAVLGLCRTFGGAVFYLPMGAAAERKARDFDIYKAWKNNVSIPQLAREYRLSSQTIYEIVARERKSATLKNSQEG